jgi:formylglycine-generating enzyme required for sulfatase activity
MIKKMISPLIYTLMLSVVSGLSVTTTSCNKNDDNDKTEQTNPDENNNDNDMDTANKTTYKLNGVAFAMVTVEGGTFTMGSDERAKGGGTQVSNQAGEHQVTISTFMIGETEVTRALWNEVMKGSHSNSDLKYPIASVTVPDCRLFVQKLNEKAHAAGIIPADKNFYIPTEAQWEFAAKGGNNSKGYTYAGSNNLSEVGWTSDDGSSVHPVKQKKPNELGIYDMSGNVYEWVADYAAPYTTEAQTNPCNTKPSNNYIKRGGSFYYNDPYRFTSTYRYFYSSTDYTIGLRIALY